MASVIKVVRGVLLVSSMVSAVRGPYGFSTAFFLTESRGGALRSVKPGLLREGREMQTDTKRAQRLPSLLSRRFV
jgi:hypothetical protein